MPVAAAAVGTPVAREESKTQHSFKLDEIGLSLAPSKEAIEEISKLEAEAAKAENSLRQFSLR